MGALIPVRLVAVDGTASESVTWRNRCMWRTAFRSPKHQGDSRMRLDRTATLGTSSKVSSASCYIMNTR